MSPLNRITRDPQIMDENHCIRGVRVTVGRLVGLVASGRSHAEILSAYPYLEKTTSPSFSVRGVAS